MLLLQQFSQHCLASYYSRRLSLASELPSLGQPPQDDRDPAILIAISDYNYAKVHHANLQFRKLIRKAAFSS